MFTTRDVASIGRSWLSFLVLPVMLSAGCADLASEPRIPPNAPPPPAAPSFPPLTRAADVYLGPEGLYDRFISFHGSRLASRYVIYDDGTFTLQFACLIHRFFEYPGHYARAGSQIAFTFGANPTEPSGAIGTVRGDDMTVSYTLDMAMADFLDGVYARSRATP